MANTRGFTKRVQEKYGMRPVIPWQTPIRVGDIGFLGPDGVWNPISTTRQRFGVAPGGVRKNRDSHGMWFLESGKDVQFKAYTKGETSKLVTKVANAKARAEIEFNSAHSFVFAAREVMVSSATEMDALIDAIRLAYHNRKNLPEERSWNANLAFVFAVAHASRFVAVLADKAETAIELRGSAKVGPPATAADLTAKVTFGVFSKELQHVNITSAPDCFYRAYKLDPSVLKRWNKEKVREVRFAASGWNLRGGPDRFDVSAGTMFGPNSFDSFGGEEEAGFRVSRARTPSFEETFTEI